jgi:hypothetical protein
VQVDAGGLPEPCALAAPVFVKSGINDATGNPKTIVNIRCTCFFEVRALVLDDEEVRFRLANSDATTTCLSALFQTRL